VNFAVDINHVPCRLKLADIVVTQQSIFLIGVEQGKVLHNNGCNDNNIAMTSNVVNDNNMLALYASLTDTAKQGRINR
jgi:hypothetical protein